MRNKATIKNSRTPIYIPIFLTIIILFFIITNIIWLKLDATPPAWDQSHHMFLSLKYLRILSKLDSIADLKQLFFVSNYYPSFFHITTVLISWLFGFSEDNITLVNSFYIILVTIGIFGIGSILFNRRVGVISSMLILFYPLMYAMSRECLVDFAHVAMVTVVLYLILKSKGGIKKPWNMFLGIAAGFSLLTKSASIIFFLPIWILVFLQNYKEKKDLLALFIAFIISIIICGPWYLFNFKILLMEHQYWQLIAKTVEGNPVKFIPSILYYARELNNTVVSFNLMFFFFFGLVSFLLFDKRWKLLFIFFTGLIFAILILIFTPNKDARYIMPILPIIAVFTIGGIDAIPKRFIRNTIYCLILMLGYIQFNNLSFNIPPYLIKANYYNRTPLREDWKVKAILEDIHQRVGNKPIVIGILPDCQYFNPQTFIFFNSMLNLPYVIEGIGYQLTKLERMTRYDIFITKYPKLSAEWTAANREKLYQELNEYGFERLGFRQIAEFKLPDGSTAKVYKKNIQ